MQNWTVLFTSLFIFQKRKRRHIFCHMWHISEGEKNSGMAMYGMLKALECFMLGIILIMLVRRLECSRDVLSLGESLSVNQTIISENGTFALGFFSPNGSTNLYVGIWFAQIPDKSVVWVANREAPLKDTSTVLNLSTDGYLSLFDSQNHESLWSTETVQKGKASSVKILENGNLVMLGGQNKSETVWESFEHPTDTWLTEMKMWKGMRLTSWKSAADPAPGPFSLGMDPSPGKTQFLLLYNSSKLYWTTGEWVVDRFIYVPELTISGSTLVPSEFVKYSPTSMYFRYLHPDSSQRIPQRLVMFKSGDLRSFYGFANGQWNVVWSAPRDQCSVYDMCGAYGTCTSLNIQFCNCLRGFKPKDNSTWYSQEWWASGCVRRTPLNCSTDKFIQLTDKSFPDNAIPSMQTTLKGCNAACFRNCSCTAFAITNSTPPTCQLWFGDLINVRNLANARPLFVRMAASELVEGKRQANHAANLAICISLPLAAAAALAAVAAAVLIVRRRRRLGQHEFDHELPASLRTFTYKELQAATKNFKAKHKLGKGAFGVVYKGMLPDNSLVAVKKLQGSGQAEKQFRAEISTIGNIQHVNLVRLRGFCSEGSQRLLVYEFLPNGSLNSFLSRPKSSTPQKVLDWKTRFQIALGCARGLFYLHEECRDRIIHCDIKPENILLDADFSPKVADFGLAKLVGRDFSRVLTTTRGTRGYLAPEWISGLPITPKADVYSFGMTLLEIISGRRNIDLDMQESSKYYFPTWAANQIHEGNVMSLVDERISGNDDLDAEEVKRAAFVSMLCIQEDEKERPSMGEVILMMEGKMEPHATHLSASLQLLVSRHVGAQQTDSSS